MDAPSPSIIATPPFPGPPPAAEPVLPPELVPDVGAGGSELVELSDPLPGVLATSVGPDKVEEVRVAAIPEFETSAAFAALESLFFAPTTPPTTAATTTTMSIATIPMIPLGVRQNGRLAIDAGALPDSAMRIFSFDTFSGMAGVAGGNGAPGSGTAAYGGTGVAAGVRTDCERCGRLSSRSTS